MEHILQFAINIDDATIKKNIEAKAEKEVIDFLKRDIKRSILNDWGDLVGVGQNMAVEIMQTYKDEIIQKAVELVADSIKRSKKYREALADIVEEMNDDR